MTWWEVRDVEAGLLVTMNFKFRREISRIRCHRHRLRRMREQDIWVDQAFRWFRLDWSCSYSGLRVSEVCVLLTNQDKTIEIWIKFLNEFFSSLKMHALVSRSTMKLNCLPDWRTWNCVQRSRSCIFASVQHHGNLERENERRRQSQISQRQGLKSIKIKMSIKLNFFVNFAKRSSFLVQLSLNFFWWNFLRSPWSDKTEPWPWTDSPAILSLPCC
jgi:hypothetical protein